MLVIKFYVSMKCKYTCKMQIVHKGKRGQRENLWQSHEFASLIPSKMPQKWCLCLVLMAKHQAYSWKLSGCPFGAAMNEKVQLIFLFSWLSFWGSELNLQQIKPLLQWRIQNFACVWKVKKERRVLMCFLAWRWSKLQSLEWDFSLSQSLANLQQQRK